MTTKAELEQQLMVNILSFKNDPYGFVMYNYPWGVAGTPLADKDGPSEWQIELMQDMAQHLLNNENLKLRKIETDMWRSAIASGHGIGKSCAMAWLTHWFQSTRVGATTVVTANTEAQLRGKTWAELGRWVTLGLNKHWFNMTATRLLPSKWFGDMVEDQLKIDTKYYYAEAVTWNEDNPEAFAGIHSHIGTQFIFDEGSGIPHPIWEVTKGAMTDSSGDKLWNVFGNPTQNSGPFFECFHKSRKYWRTRNIDSRTVKITNKKYLAEIVEEHGEDDDVTRVRVKGEFPKQGSNQFISTELVDDAVEREITFDAGAPLVMGVDVARFGEDESVIAIRQGRDARSIPMQVFNCDTMTLSNYVAMAADKYKPEAIFVDGGGVGGGVVDRLKEMGYRAIEVQFGGRADEKNTYFNKRCELWGRMRDWMTRGAIESHERLRTDLISPLYKYLGDASQIYLERKDEMKKRGLSSPDYGDALALTFAKNVARRDFKKRLRRVRMASDVEFDLFQ